MIPSIALAGYQAGQQKIEVAAPGADRMLAAMTLEKNRPQVLTSGNLSVLNELFRITAGGSGNSDNIGAFDQVSYIHFDRFTLSGLCHEVPALKIINADTPDF